MRAVFVLFAFLGFPLIGPANAADVSIELEKAAQYFREFDQLCKEDGGKLWGVSFCGPMVFVDPVNRMAAGNEADAEGELKSKAGVFAGELPPEVMIANTAVEWGGKRWTMIMWWSISSETDERLALLAHEAFHRIQPQLGLTPSAQINSHLDTGEARFWLQMEWNALQKALSSKGQARRDAVSDALTFRVARRAFFPGAAENEGALEIFEGLAEYSGRRLAGFSSAKLVEAITARRGKATGFVRSFAYITGPLYGFLLDEAAKDWRKSVTAKTDLGVSLGQAVGAEARPVKDAERLAEPYGGAALRKAEHAREERRVEQLAAWRTSLIDGPILIVDLKSVTAGTFDPRAVFPFSDKQTVYTTRELQAEWGTLTVKDGAILEDLVSRTASVSLQGAAPDHLRGNGWTLKLNPGWVVRPGERAGDFVVAKE